jgi:hypothetical protein
MAVPPVNRPPIPPPPPAPPAALTGRPDFTPQAAPRPQPAWLPWVAGAAVIALTALTAVTGTLYVTHRHHGPQQVTVVAEPSPSSTAGDGSQATLMSDLKTAAIAEESYATDNLGTFVADTASGANPDPADPLVAQGLTLDSTDSLIAQLFTTSTTNDSFCLTMTSTRTPVVWYLSSTDDTPTVDRPDGC